MSVFSVVQIKKCSLVIMAVIQNLDLTTEHEVICITSLR